MPVGILWIKAALRRIMAAKMIEAGKDSLHNSNKRRVYEILEPAEKGDLESRIFDVFIVSVIIVSVLAAMLRTMAGVIEDYGILLRSVEVFCIIIFYGRVSFPSLVMYGG